MQFRKLATGLLVLVTLVFVGCFNQKEEEKGKALSNNAASTITEIGNTEKISAKRAFTKNYPTMNLRGTCNSWRVTPMILTNNNEWKMVNVEFGTTSTERFKFDVNGDWVTNFGDTNKDGIGEAGGADIFVTAGQKYDITFNDSTKKYTVTKSTLTNPFACTYQTMYFRGTPNNWENAPMTLISDYTWSIKGVQTGNTTTERFKVDVKGDWFVNFGKDGVSCGDDISLEANATYDITFNDKTKVFTITKRPIIVTTTAMNIRPYLTWNKANQAPSGIVINYGTTGSCIAKVEYGTTTAFGMTATGVEVNVNSYLYLHHVVIDGLTPGTRYYYRVDLGGGTKSETYNFRTADSNDTNYKFFMMGDQQDFGATSGSNYWGQRWADVASAMKNTMNNNQIDFIICTGDMPLNDTIDYWIKFFELGKDVLPYIVMMPAIGNHETISDSSDPSPAGVADFKKFFKYIPTETRAGITNDGTYYSFNYGSAQFNALNTEVVNNATVYFNTNAQYTWAKDKINAEAAGFTWNFAYYHIPAYNSTNAHYPAQSYVRPFTDIFDGKEDWVISGHVHAYQRMKPLRYNGQIKATYGTGTDQGVGYMVLPPAGNNPRDYAWQSTADANMLQYPLNGNITNLISEMGFGLVSITNRNINIKVYGVGNATVKKTCYLMDEVNYTK